MLAIEMVETCGVRQGMGEVFGVGSVRGGAKRAASLRLVGGRRALWGLSKEWDTMAPIGDLCNSSDQEQLLRSNVLPVELDSP